MKSSPTTHNTGAREQYLRLGQAIICLIITTILLNVLRAVLQSLESAFVISETQFDLIYLAASIVSVSINGILLFHIEDRLIQTLYALTAIIMLVSQPGFYVHANLEVLQHGKRFANVASLTLFGLLSYRAIILLMVADQQRQQRLLEHLAWGTSHRVGPDFLAGLVSTIVDTMNVDVAFVSESDPDSVSERIVSSAASGDVYLPKTLTPGKIVKCTDADLGSLIRNHAAYLLDLRDPDHQVIGHFCLFHDQTEEISAGQQSSLQIFASRASAELLRLRADKKTDAMEARMHQVQKLESLGVLAGGIAHDFNNLLQAIQGYTTLATDTLSPGSTSYKSIRRIDDVVRKGAAMCDRLLAYAGRSVRSDAVCQLDQLVTEAVDFVRSARPECTVNLDQSSQPLSVWGDSAQLSQVLINLLTNAADAIDPGRGEIQASTHIVQTSSEICTGLELDADNEYAVISIRDNGCGIPEDAKSKLFDPFFTSKGDGRGIGLAAVSGIVKSHRGDISFSSEVGVGTTFVVAFPLTPEQHEHSGTSGQQPVLPSNLRILAVDDDEMVLATTRLLLESASLDITTANSGQDAVQLIEENDAPFDVVLLDQTMPGMSGLETCEELRRHGVEAPFILMSGYCKIEDVAELSQVTCLSKPYSRQELLDAISDASNRIAVHADVPV